MLRTLLFSLAALLLRVCSAQQGNNSFISPPSENSDSDSPRWSIGSTVTARWSSNYSTINLVLWTDFSLPDGNKNIIRLISDGENQNSYEFLVGGNIELDQGSKFYLEVLETDHSNDGKETGARFRTKDFDIVPGPTSAAPTITQTLAGTTIILSPSSTPQSTATASASPLGSTTSTGAPGPSDTGTSNGLSDSGKVGVGVGVGVGVPLAVAAVAALMFLLRRMSRKKNAGNGMGIAHASDPNPGLEKPAGTNASNQYR